MLGILLFATAKNIHNDRQSHFISVKDLFIAIFERKIMRPIFLLFLGCAFLFSSCSSLKYKDINYLEQDYASTTLPHLNIFRPKKAEGKNDVLIFVHGGDWNSGNKNTYGFFGRGFAKRGVVTVIPDYTLSPRADYDTMAQQVAEAIKWTSENIKDYGGDPQRIFITGHSAGGHLAALATMNPKYLNDSTMVKGIILNDAGGLDIYSYLQNYPPTQSNNYLSTWTKEKQNWKEASPIYFLDKDTPPIMMYVGSKTYPAIFKYNELFNLELKNYDPDAPFIVLDKKHKAMIKQYLWPWSKRFDEVLKFMNAQE